MSQAHGTVHPPALFLDRDGVINAEVGYLYRPEDVTFLPGVFAMCRVAKRLGYKIVVVTNQSGIARQLYTEAQYQSLMSWMRLQFLNEGIELDAVYHCPYHPEYGLGEYRREHEDRKPGPGMLLRAARDLHIDLARSIMVGDRCTDVGAANAAAIGQTFLLKGTEPADCPGFYEAVEHLTEVERWIERNANYHKR